MKTPRPQNESGGKVCTLCHEWLAFSHFSPDKCHRDGYKSHCRGCRSVQGKERTQSLFEARYLEGDTKYDLCDCGNYYKNEKLVKQKWQIYYHCPDCREGQEHELLVQ